MTAGKTIALTMQTFVSKVMSLLLHTLSRFVTDEPGRLPSMGWQGVGHDSAIEHRAMIFLPLRGIVIYPNLKLEKEMATHSSTLAWKIPWTEEPGRLQSMGSQRVGHN